MKENRCFIRVNHRANINITFSSGETIKAHTLNLSDSGLLIECLGHPILHEGDLAEIIVLGIEGAVSRAVKVIRIEPRGRLGIQFI